MVTTSRGVANSLPIAEYAVAGILHFAMGFHRAAIDREAGAFDHRAYRPLLVHGKTVCVVGAGGIGSEVGRLCAALGMRVVGTRRQPQPGAPLPHGFSPLRTDSRQLVSKICWRRTTSGAIIDAPEWRKPTGFVCFAPALREHPGGCGSADHPKLPVQPRL